jgi:poly-gamma-glutamate synthesis protein (capsule biosynthesis protein)
MMRRGRELKRLHVILSYLLMAFLIMALMSAVSTDSTAETKEDRITLVFTGDIMIGRDIEDEIDEREDVHHPFRGISTFTQQGDLTFGNLENCVSERGKPENKVYTFRCRPSTLEGLKEAGFDIMSLANNHVCDFGSDATKDTITHLEEYGIEHFGLWYLNEDARNATIPRPVIMEVKGVKFAFLGYGENLSYESIATDVKPGPVPTRLDVMKADIEYAKELADVVIVSIHWVRLPQYIEQADEGQIEICHKLSDWGADIQAHHGPHTCQEIEYYNGSLIMYSLGNAVFDLSRTESHRSFIAMVHMEGKNLTELELVPIVKNEHEQYIAQGNILQANIEDGLYLDWGDYESRMFSSDEPLTDYEGPERTWQEILLSPPVFLTILITLVIITLILILILVRRRRRDSK